jgi:hypothetical protein
VVVEVAVREHRHPHRCRIRGRGRRCRRARDRHRIPRIPRCAPSRPCRGVGGARAHPLRRPPRLLPGAPRPCAVVVAGSASACRFPGDGGYIIAPPSKVLRPGGVRAPYRLIVASGDTPVPVDAARLREFLDPRTPIPLDRARPALIGSSGGGRMRRCSPVGWRGVVRVSGTGACSGPRAVSPKPAPRPTQPSTHWGRRQSTRGWGRGRSWRRSAPPTAPPTPHRARPWSPWRMSVVWCADHQGG